MFGYLSLWSVFWLFKLVTGKEGMGYGDFAAGHARCLGRLADPAADHPAVVAGRGDPRVIMLRLRNAESGTPIPFGPYLAIAGWIALLWVIK